MFSQHSTRDKLIVALDGDSLEHAADLVDLLKGEVTNFKIGMQLFTACGPDAIKMVQAHGGKVFLDLKYHDIPSTVAKAVYIATKLKVAMINIHATGGRKMMAESLAAVQDAADGDPPLIIGVTVLTSMESLGDIGIQYEIREQVIRLAKLAQEVGLHGVLASPLEIQPIRAACGKKFIIMTPGIRPTGTHLDDQARISSPKQAIHAGADFLVIGRPVTEAKDPLLTVRNILKEMG
ncbi:MAG: orotidine-5'-phosphate decarboxylase [Deltaproteobacteria bacterium CG11_big_fil_rev_8_21_14_0_20_49_13]|nr:MAG: orotidine-5'-phosphate decarboxylase [Deltaproteobacteria bacterium CG11_big_fil_rev_8_21_14_0_20_49_13]